MAAAMTTCSSSVDLLRQRSLIVPGEDVDFSGGRWDVFLQFLPSLSFLPSFSLLFIPRFEVAPHIQQGIWRNAVSSPSGDGRENGILQPSDKYTISHAAAPQTYFGVCRAHGRERIWLQM